MLINFVANDQVALCSGEMRSIRRRCSHCLDLTRSKENVSRHDQNCSSVAQRCRWGVIGFLRSVCLPLRYQPIIRASLQRRLIMIPVNWEVNWFVSGYKYASRPVIYPSSARLDRVVAIAKNSKRRENRRVMIYGRTLGNCRRLFGSRGRGRFCWWRARRAS